MIKNIGKKTIGIIEMITLIVSTFAFAFIISSAFVLNTPVVSAQTTSSSSSGTSYSGCCLNTVSGGICQEMNSFDSASCLTPLVLSGCETIDQCRTGCCYDVNGGSCSFNSPKGKCGDDGGEWSNDPNCGIEQCVLGCCVLGDQAAISTSRQCSLLAKEYDFEREFNALDADGTCETYNNLGDKGACVTSVGDYSGDNECTFGTKEACATGTFYKDYLCTAETLNTTCYKSTNTACLEDKDQIYFVDTCGNTANVYDATRATDQSYWETIVLSEDSCSPASADCGNCDYLTGSRCYEYRAGQDTTPTYGNYVCRDLNCDNGKNHGESWCISDYANVETAGVAPIGSRFFKGNCINGEISIEGCADFNNELCMELVGTSGYTEARCIPNEWRSCIAANSKTTYDEIKTECNKYDQCVMFEDIPYGDTNSSAPWLGLPGFIKSDTVNSGLYTPRGNSGDIGGNSVIVHCVPKYTPGMVFWSTSTTSTSSSTSTTSTSSSYGGSIEETNAICSLASFNCVAHEQIHSATADWHWEENPLCADPALHPDTDTARRADYIQGLAERCRMLGPCSLSVNIAGELGSENATKESFQRTSVDRDGDQTGPSALTSWDYSQTYLENLKEIAAMKIIGSITSLSDSNLIGSPVYSESLSSSLETPSGSGTSGGLPTGSEGASWGTIGGYSLVLGTVGTYANGATVAKIAGVVGKAAAPYLYSAMWAVVWAAAGYVVGQLVGKLFGFDGPTTQALSYALAAGFGLTSVAITTGVLTTSVAPTAAGYGFGAYTSLGTSFGWCWICVAIIIVAAILTYIFTYQADQFYVTQYACSAWEPPEKGECGLCNSDVRPCSDYRCRSIGKNCHYFTDMGEPGWCATLTDTGSATISPWPEIITSGYEYSNVAELSFQVQATDSEEVNPYQGITWGIITDKPATCKIDILHTDDYESMSTTFATDNTNPEYTENTHHQIAISSYVNSSNSGTSTLGIVKGEETNYYIRCKNFAGYSNDAEFVVKIKAGQGPDYVPPNIVSFYPASETYLGFGKNSTSITLYVDEPATCRYSQGSDARYDDMTKSLSCLTSSSSSNLGTWPCSGTLTNLTSSANTFYFKCADQPDIAERSDSSRNRNENPKVYVMNICQTGLNITSIEPKEKIVVGKGPVSVDLSVETSGCIEKGKSICSYAFRNNGTTGFYSSFYSTDSTSHKQTFDSMITQDYNISIKCEDSAGNSAQGEAFISILLDNSAPQVVRHYDYKSSLYIVTNENAECLYTSNSTINCGLSFGSNLSTVNSMTGTELTHSAPWKINTNYYIKCKDIYDNVNSCTEIKTY